MKKENRYSNDRPLIDGHQHNIQSWYYYAEASVLEVEFLGGRVYRYFNVGVMTAESFATAESLGSYFAQCIRNMKLYPYIRLKPGQDEIDPKPGDYERWLQEGVDQLKDDKMFKRDRDADRAGILGETRRIKKVRVL